MSYDVMVGLSLKLCALRGFLFLGSAFGWIGTRFLWFRKNNLW